LEIVLAGEEEVGFVEASHDIEDTGLVWCGRPSAYPFCHPDCNFPIRFVQLDRKLAKRPGVDQDAVAALFNLGLIICGALTAIFAIGLKGTLPRSTRGSVGAITLFLGALALCSAGAFRSTVGVEYLVHYYTSGLFFALVIISLLLIGSAMMQEPSERNLGLFVFITGLFTCTVGIALVVIDELSPWGGAIPEFLISLGASVCYIILGVRLFKRTPHKVRG